MLHSPWGSRPVQKSVRTWGESRAIRTLAAKVRIADDPLRTLDSTCTARAFRPPSPTYTAGCSSGRPIFERRAGIRATLLRNQAAAGDLRQALPKPVKSLPEPMPRLTCAAAHKNVCMIPDGNVLDAVWNRKVAGKFARLEYSLEVGAQKT